MDHTVITIGRQFGSGGGIIAQQIGKRLGIPVYDNELISRAAEESGFSKELFTRSDEKRSLFSLSGFFAPWRSAHAGDSFISDDAMLLSTAAWPPVPIPSLRIIVTRPLPSR